MAALVDHELECQDRFNPVYITCFGYADVDKVLLSFNNRGEIIKAEAELIDATYERMLIDDPSILRIFDERGEKIDMSVLHPCPKFRLDPVDCDTVEDDEEPDFVVARLVDITNLPKAARFGSTRFKLGMIDRF